MQFLNLLALFLTDSNASLRPRNSNVMSCRDKAPDTDTDPLLESYQSHRNTSRDRQHADDVNDAKHMWHSMRIEKDPLQRQTVSQT